MKLFSQFIFGFLLFSFSLSVSADALIDREDAFIFLANQLVDDVPESYQYIQLDYKNIEPHSEIEDALQILVYKDLIKNTSTDLGLNKYVSVYIFEKLAEKIIHIQVSKEQSDIDKKSIYIKQSDITSIQKVLDARETNKSPTIKINAGLSTGNSSQLGDKGSILYDVYETLNHVHYDRNDFEESQLVEGAIKGLAEASQDKYTTYFPPVESKDFFQGLDGEYEGIGAYVDMNAPGELIIVSPIVGSPSEQAGVKGGDRVTHVDNKEIGIENPLEEVISWIKGPAGTRVKLTIVREEETEPLHIYVTREKIILKDVEHKSLDDTTYYIQIKSFGDHVDTDFKGAIQAILADEKIEKIIFDLRNNPGGYLGEVSTMLSYFIEQGAATAIVDNGKNETKYTSKGYDLIDFSQYKLVFLQNGGSASASEIMIGTVKDYYPNAVIIGEKSFGKGSVQSLKTYYDGSTLKYTTAKWFTGKTKQGIDGIGISPDIELKFDSKRWETFKKDNQLERAMSQ